MRPRESEPQPPFTVLQAVRTHQSSSQMNQSRLHSSEKQCATTVPQVLQMSPEEKAAVGTLQGPNQSSSQVHQSRLHSSEKQCATTVPQWTSAEEKAAVEALQGLWANNKDSSETYRVTGLDAVRTRPNEGPRKFTLRWDRAHRRLDWATGKYFLQPPGDGPVDTVVWVASDSNGGRGFSWRRLSASNGAREAGTAVACEGVPKARWQQKWQPKSADVLRR